MLIVNKNKFITNKTTILKIYKYIYIRAIIWLVKYIHSLSLFFDLKAGILKIPGNRLKQNGYTIDKQKLIIVSFIKIICVFIYTMQKQEMKYQKKSIIIKLNIKKKANLIFKQDSVLLDLSKASFIFLIFLISKIEFSDKDNDFKIILITVETKVEYINLGIWKIISYFPLSS